VFKRAANQRPVQEVSTARALNQLEPQKFAVSTQEKKINGVKQHIMVDTLGLLLLVVVHSAAIQDRDGAKLVMERAKGRFPRLKLIWADGGYTGKLIEYVLLMYGWILQIVKRSDDQKGFVLLPRPGSSSELSVG
jgi:Transposase DDE domain.